LLSKTLETKAQKQLKSWEETYRKDSLTGLLNHMAFVNDFEQKRITNPELGFMLLLIDIDNFKKYNDTYGHHAGDEFLVVISQAIASSINSNSLACRLGGDEFMMAIFYQDKEDYQAIAKKIFDKISIRLSTLEKTTTFSMGVAKHMEQFHSFNDHYEAVDKVLYTSKDSGKNRISFYEVKNETN
jgi:diguanylate cyclase (GGDEF)-like protein